MKTVGMAQSEAPLVVSLVDGMVIFTTPQQRFHPHVRLTSAHLSAQQIPLVHKHSPYIQRSADARGKRFISHRVIRVYKRSLQLSIRRRSTDEDEEDEMKLKHRRLITSHYKQEEELHFIDRK